ncbi:MAG: hypothetical protein AAB876_03230 [Patescibacteria group bacterium]|mgnify:CR=1 FL=1
MEKPILNISAVYSFLTEGSVGPVTTQTNPPTGSCSSEQSFELPEGLRYMCVAMTFGMGLFKHYKYCKFINGVCPLNKYIPTIKIETGQLEIEKKWAVINAANNK